MAKKRKKRVVQKLLRFGANGDGRGGVRENSGRLKAKTSGVPHRTRPEHKARYPLHITLKLKRGLPALRTARVMRVLEPAFSSGMEKFGLRMNHYSIQSDHLHLIVEAEDRAALTRGLKGLAGRIAKALNKLWKRKGGILAERYHESVLTTPRQVRHAIAYVLKNALKHGRRMPTRDTVDPFTSGAWFDGWRDEFRTCLEDGDVPLVVPARTWLLSKGWRKCGLVPVAVLG
jgi:REP element-mobilizing transposase RayT